MAMRIRFQGPTGSTYAYAIERLADGAQYDFATSAFTLATPTTPTQALPENAPAFPGQYRANLATTPATQFSDGNYAVTVLDQVAASVAGLLVAVMHAGDDQTVIPDNTTLGTAAATISSNLDAKVSTRSTFTGGAVASVTAPVVVGTNNDKVGYAITQAFPSNFAAMAINAVGGVTAGTVADKVGYALAQAFPSNFAAMAINAAGGVTAGTVADKTGYAITQTFPANFAGLSVSPGGGIAVGSYAAGQDPASLVLTTPANKLTTDNAGRVTAGTVADKSGYALAQAFPSNFAAMAINAGGGVTAGTVADKTGYALAAAGLDAITVEAGINARQALSPILAASAGVVTGAGTGSIVIRGANNLVSRIVASTDNSGNRTSVTLTLPS